MEYNAHPGFLADPISEWAELYESRETSTRPSLPRIDEGDRSPGLFHEKHESHQNAGPGYREIMWGARHELGDVQNSTEQSQAKDDYRQAQKKGLQVKDDYLSDRRAELDSLLHRSSSSSSRLRDSGGKLPNDVGDPERPMRKQGGFGSLFSPYLSELEDEKDSPLSTQEASAHDGELACKQPLTTYTYVNLSAASRPAEPSPFGIVEVVLREKRSANFVLSVRELVLRSKLAGDDHRMIEHKFWIPLSEVKTEIHGAQVEISWSDCDHLEKAGTRDGILYRRIYSHSMHNNTVQLVFMSEAAASEFTHRIHTPGKAVPDSSALDHLTRAFGVIGDGDSEETVQLSACPGSNSARIVIHSSRVPPSTQVTRLYLLKPETDIWLDASAGRGACIRFFAFGVPKYSSTAGLFGFHKIETTRGFPVAEVSLGSQDVEFIMNSTDDRNEFLEGLTAHHLSLHLAEVNLTVKGLLFCKRYGTVGLSIWAPAPGSGRVPIIAFRMESSIPDGKRWLFATLPVSCDRRYSKLSVTITVQSPTIHRTMLDKIHPNLHHTTSASIPERARTKQLLIVFSNDEELYEFDKALNSLGQTDVSLSRSSGSSSRLGDRPSTSSTGQSSLNEHLSTIMGSGRVGRVDSFPDETSDPPVHQSQDLYISQFLPVVTPPYRAVLSPRPSNIINDPSMAESNALFRRIEHRDVRGDAPRNRQPQREADHIHTSRQGIEVAPAARQRSPIPVDAGSSLEQHGHDCDSESLSTTTGGSLIDNQGEFRLLADGLSETAGDPPLASNTSADTFTQVQLGIERLLLDLQSFEDELRDGASVTESASSEVSEAEDPCDNDGNETESQQASGGTARVTDIGDHEHHASGRKRQRCENSNRDRSRATIKITQKKTSSDSKQMLICCFRGDSETPCLGTDEYICDVISTLEKHHGIRFCSKGCMLLESVSGNNVHPSGDCVKHCLSPTCAGNPTPTGDQRHRHVENSCPTRSKPCDRESIYRYIFRLVNPTREQPDDVFTPRKQLHEGVRPRRRTRGPTREELLEQARALTADAHALATQVEELRRQDAARTTHMEVMARDLEAERRANANSAEKLLRLEDVIRDCIQPGALNSEHWYLSILQRVRRDAPDALGYAPAPSQPFQTGPGSLHTSQKSNTMPSPNDTGTTGQDQSYRDANLQHHSNEAADPLSSNALGKRPARDLMPESNLVTSTIADHHYSNGGMNYTTTTPAPDTVPEYAPSLDGQPLHDVPGGGFDPSDHMINNGIHDCTNSPYLSEFVTDSFYAGSQFKE